MTVWGHKVGKNLTQEGTNMGRIIRYHVCALRDGWKVVGNIVGLKLHPISLILTVWITGPF